MPNFSAGEASKRRESYICRALFWEKSSIVFPRLATFGSRYHLSVGHTHSDIIKTHELRKNVVLILPKLWKARHASDSG